MTPPGAQPGAVAGPGPRTRVEPVTRPGVEALPARLESPALPAPAPSHAPDALPERIVDAAERPLGMTPAQARPEDGAEPRATCTGAQLRRFIKSRPWVPMHELRRRFGINGADDDVTPISVGDARLFVGLPGPEGQVLGELLRSGDVGYELSVDPCTPVVIGVYPMRPVPRG